MVYRFGPSRQTPKDIKRKTARNRTTVLPVELENVIVHVHHPPNSRMQEIADMCYVCLCVCANKQMVRVFYTSLYLQAINTAVRNQPVIIVSSVDCTIIIIIIHLPHSIMVARLMWHSCMRHTHAHTFSVVHKINERYLHAFTTTKCSIFNSNISSIIWKRMRNIPYCRLGLDIWCSLSSLCPFLAWKQIWRFFRSI